MKKLFMSVIVLFFYSSSLLLAQTASIIVNKSITETSISKEDLRKIFLGKKELWDNGARVILVIQQPSKSQAANTFFSSVIEMDIVKYRKYWIKKVFAGNGTKPNEFSSDSEVIGFVMKNPGSIGVISSDNITAEVKEVTKL